MYPILNFVNDGGARCRMVCGTQNDSPIADIFSFLWPKNRFKLVKQIKLHTKSILFSLHTHSYQCTRKTTLKHVLLCNCRSFPFMALFIVNHKGQLKAAQLNFMDVPLLNSINWVHTAKTLPFPSHQRLIP